MELRLRLELLLAIMLDQMIPFVVRLVPSFILIIILPGIQYIKEFVVKDMLSI
jgi:hypothetical protein